MKKLLFIPLVLSLAACKTDSTPEPIIKTVYVSVPVPQPCVPKTLGPPPAYVDTDQALRSAIDAAVRYQLLYAGRLQRQSRLGEVELVVQSCPKEK